MKNLNFIQDECCNSPKKIVAASKPTPEEKIFKLLASAQDMILAATNELCTLKQFAPPYTDKPVKTALKQAYNTALLAESAYQQLLKLRAKYLSTIKPTP